MNKRVRNCDRCGKLFFEPYKEYLCRDCLDALKWNATYHTNADHIRSMSDEELAEFMCDATYKENEQGYPIMRTVNKVWWHKWLKQPYKEES